MGKKIQNVEVTLVSNQGRVESFEFQLAERILSMPRQGGWNLPEDSPFELTEDGLIYKPDSGISKESKKSAGNK
jgi:hypothetical protein